MPNKTTKKMPSFEGVAAGQTASLRLPIGQSYRKLFIAYSGVTLAQMLEMRIVVNGDVRHRIASVGTYIGLNVLDKMNQFEGRAAASGEFIFDFERYGLETALLREITKLGTGVLDDPYKITTLTIEIDIDGAAAAPVLSARAERSGPAVVGDIIRTRLFQYNAPAVGEFEISDLPKGEVIQKVYFGAHVARAYSRLVVERDNFIEYDKTAAEISQSQNDGVRVPQTDFLVYDPSEDGEGAQFLATNVQDLRFRLTVGVAGAVPIIVETIGRPDL